MRRALKILLVLVAGVVAWLWLFTGTPPWGARLPLRDAAVTSIDLTWFGANHTITASAQCGQVIQTMRKARQSPAPMTPGLGTLTLHYADGVTNQYYLEPSGRSSALAIGNKSGGYAISMDEMLGTFERVGLLPKNEK
jgi:hypothetical protein